MFRGSSRRAFGTEIEGSDDNAAQLSQIAPSHDGQDSDRPKARKT